MTVSASVLHGTLRWNRNAVLRVFLVIWLVLSLIACGPPPYDLYTFSIAGGRQVVMTYLIKVSDATLDGSLLVQGNETIDFSIEMPSGAVLSIGPVRGHYDFHYDGLAAGPYLIMLSNPDPSAAEKVVVLQVRAYGSSPRR